ncbi:MAG: GFA family protein [Myxococcota bacterium]
MLTGHCLCGAIRYEVNGRALALMYCHCEECRRATGSSLNTSILVKRDDFRVRAGDDALGFHESSPGNRRHFCTRCGSPLFKLFPVPRDLMTIRAGTLDSDPGVRPSAHIWVSEKAPWYEIDDGLPQFPKGMPRPPADPA